MEKRITVERPAELLELSKGRTWHILRELRLRGKVKKLGWGLYEYVGEEEEGNEPEAESG